MENRMKIIQDSEPDLVVSIHLNSYPQDTSVCGAQVFYPEAQEGSSKTTSMILPKVFRIPSERHFLAARDRKPFPKTEYISLTISHGRSYW